MLAVPFHHWLTDCHRNVFLGNKSNVLNRGILTARVSGSRKSAANNGRLMSPLNKCLLTVECIWEPCVTKERKKAGILFYKDRTHTLSLGTEAHNPRCHPGQSIEPFTWSTQLTMALHPPMYAEHVTFFSNACVRSKVDQRFHTGSWAPCVQISPSPSAIRLYLRPKASIYSGGFHPAKLLVKQKQEGTFQPLSCQWCAGSGLYQLVRTKWQIVLDLGGQ